MTIANKISQVIVNVAIQENSTLSSLVKEGIFYMPELAFAYDCGKAIMAKSKSIFGDNTPTWLREVGLENGGPTDLVFEFNDGKKIAIEFKLRDTSHAYIRDIKKLSELKDNNTLRIFCALIDVFTDKLPDDGRQKAIEDLKEYKVIEILKETFPTKSYGYVSPMSCVVALWTVGDIPDIE